MKRLFLLTTALVFLFACKKNSSSSPLAPPGTIVTSIKYVQNTTGNGSWYHLDSIQYDANQNIARLSSYDFDTIAGTIYIDTGAFYFTLNPATGLPVSYIENWYKNSWSAVITEVHNVFYDNQNRLVHDTLISATNENELYTQSENYMYTGNLIIYSKYDSTAYNNWGLNNLDSIFMNNGNLYQEVDYGDGPLAPQVQLATQTNNSFSNYANPLYNAKIMNSLGGFLQIEDGVDFLSKNLPADGILKTITDANGRVLQQFTSDSTTITYTYNK